MKNLLVTFGLFSLMLVLTSFKGISTDVTLEEMNYAIVSVDNDHRGGQIILPPSKQDYKESSDHRGGQIILPPSKQDYKESSDHRGGQIILPPSKQDFK